MNRVYQAQPKLHRTLVTQVDEADPLELSSGIVTAGYKEARFDITLEGEDVNTLEVQLMFYNPRLNVWFGGSSFTFARAGCHTISADTRGATIFLKVIDFSGTSFELTADCCLS